MADVEHRPAHAPTPLRALSSPVFFVVVKSVSAFLPQLLLRKFFALSEKPGEKQRRESLHPVYVPGKHFHSNPLLPLSLAPFRDECSCFHPLVAPAPFLLIFTGSYVRLFSRGGGAERRVGIRVVSSRRGVASDVGDPTSNAVEFPVAPLPLSRARFRAGRSVPPSEM